MDPFFPTAGDAMIRFLYQKIEPCGKAREILKASCADCAAVEMVLSD